VASASPHFGEESPLVGAKGSGTIFFASCNLKCIFCQNYEISHRMAGDEVTTEELGSMMLFLQESGCHNINFVTPSHVVPQILAAVEWSAPRGLKVPLVYNSSAYDSVATLELLDGMIDIYMPDLKCMDPQVSADLFNAPDYPDVAKEAIAEMHRQVGDLEIDSAGLATRGLLVRHLVMPDDAAGTRQAMGFLAQKISRNTYVNVMDQYRPCGQAFSHPVLGRAITDSEFERALAAAREEGISRFDRHTPFRLKFFAF
jgi:putative pyruvate formate lyase activating enzyme